MNLNRIYVRGNPVIVKTAPKLYETDVLFEGSLWDYTGNDFYTLKIPGVLTTNGVWLEFERTMICDKLCVGFLHNDYSLTIVGDVEARDIDINTGNLIVIGSLKVSGDVNITGGSLAVTGNIEVGGAINAPDGDVVTKHPSAHINAESIYCKKLHTEGMVSCSKYIDAQTSIYSGNGILCFGDIVTHGYIKSKKDVTVLGFIKAGRYVAIGGELVAMSVDAPKIITNI